MHIIDGFKTKSSFDLSMSDLDSLMLTYTPVMGSFAVSVYQMLVTQSHYQNGFKPFKKICDLMNCSMDTLKDAIIRCEQFDLIQTFIHQHDQQDYYLFLLKRPLSVIAFLDHEVYGRYLHKILNDGNIEYIRSLIMDRTVSASGYRDITHHFDQSKLEQWDHQLETDYKGKKSKTAIDLPQTIQFDTDLFIKTISPLLFPLLARTKQNIETIAYLGSLYGIDETMMQTFVGKCTKPDSEVMDLEKLKYLVQSYVDQAKTATKSGLAADSITFFSSRQKGKAVGVNDRKVIAFLYENYAFEQDVQNMLIDYVLTRFKGRFTKNLVQQIADSWERADIKTLAQAKEQINQTPIQPDQVESVPEYMITKQTKDTTSHQDEKRKALLQKLRKDDKK